MPSHPIQPSRPAFAGAGWRRRPALAVVMSCVLGVLGARSAAGAGPVRIMPLGDSITVGVGDTTYGGYRGPLSQMLSAAGYGVDFVGSQSGGTIPDPQHEGHSGWRADQIRDNISQWLNLYPADIILLHIGTNDMSQGDAPSTLITEIVQILNNVDAFERIHPATITVVIARIVNRSNPLDVLGLRTSEVNELIASMVGARIGAGDGLVLVDQESALSYPVDMADTLHPNAAGYAKMARVWFDALTPLLRNRAEWVADTIPKMVIPGRSYPLTITMRNSGHEPWRCSPYHTMLTVAQDNGPWPYTLIGAPYIAISVDPCTIDPGQECHFGFMVDVPAEAPLGTYEINWRMKDDNEWFDSNGHNTVFRKSVAVRFYPRYRGDFDDDGDVDQDDFGRLQVCLSGPGTVQDAPACQDAKLDGDADVDQDDVALLSACMSGPQVFPIAACED